MMVNPSGLLFHILSNTITSLGVSPVHIFSSVSVMGRSISCFMTVFWGIELNRGWRLLGPRLLGLSRLFEGSVPHWCKWITISRMRDDLTLYKWYVSTGGVSGYVLGRVIHTRVVDVLKFEPEDLLPCWTFLMISTGFCRGRTCHILSSLWSCVVNRLIWNCVCFIGVSWVDLGSKVLFSLTTPPCLVMSVTKRDRWESMSQRTSNVWVLLVEYTYVYSWYECHVFTIEE